MRIENVINNKKLCENVKAYCLKNWNKVYDCFLLLRTSERWCSTAAVEKTTDSISDRKNKAEWKAKVKDEVNQWNPGPWSWKAPTEEHEMLP